MNMEILIISAIVFLCVVSIFMGILNWIQFALTSSKISNLEIEIEKKAKEFDVLKKDRQAIQQQQSYVNEQQEPEEYPAQPDNLNYTESGNPPIEIIKNIGTGFKNIEIHAHNTHNGLTEGSFYPQTVKDIPHDEVDAVSTKQYVVKPIESFSEETINNFISAPEPPASANQSSDVLDIVDDCPDENELESGNGDEIIIDLFSTAKKDTDFPAAWKTLSNNLSKVSNPRVILNFKNVLFLYEKELQYLKKICDIVRDSGGSIFFSNCHIELQSIISGVPELSEHIKR